jgi:hypothetical protein
MFLAPSYIFVCLLEPCIEIWQIFLNFGQIMSIENLQIEFDYRQVSSFFFFFLFNFCQVGGLVIIHKRNEQILLKVG